MKVLRKAIHNFDLWCAYNRTYIYIRKNKSLYASMKNDPGVKFMRHGWWVVYAILALIALYGRM